MAPLAPSLAAASAFILSTALSACGSSDPVVSIIRIFEPVGQVVVRLKADDIGGTADRVSVRWEGVPDVVIRDYVYAVWLRPHPQGEPIRVARFRLPRDSILDLSIEGSALIDLTASVEVILEPDDLASAKPAPDPDFLTHHASARPQALEHIRRLLAADLAGDGAAIRLARQAQALRAATELASQAADQGDADEARRSIEHALNITAVPPEDHDKDGAVENPNGDDTGLDVHVERVANYARDAATAADSWPAAIKHGALAATVADTVADRLARLVAVYVEALAAPDLLSLRASARQALALADTLLGDPTASVTQSCLRCGALTAWHQSLLMTQRTADPQESFTVSLAEPLEREHDVNSQRLALLSRPCHHTGGP